MRLFVILTLGFMSLNANATLVSITNCTGNISNPATDCLINSQIPGTVNADPNDNKLKTWDEKQNFTLTSDLRVDRVFDTNASFVQSAGGGDYFIKAGTIISSHYIQWDSNGLGSVEATINLDSQVFGFITSRNNLKNSDYLGRTGVTYLDFAYRGSESGDLTTFNGSNTDIDWTTTEPGDWARLITAYSPAADVPEPATLALMGLGLAGVGFSRRKSTK